MKKTDYKKLPKVELHLHLDCSLSYDVVKKLRPDYGYEAYRKDFIGPVKCADLLGYLARAVKGAELMQTEEELRLVTLDLFEQLKADNVIYAEIRFAPLLHLHKGLTPHQVVKTVNAAVVEGIKKTGVEAGIILCTLRHYSEAESMQTVKLVEAFRNELVVGFDIAADEAGFPVTNHRKAFEYAHEKGLHCTAHAGEAKGPESVWETLECFSPSGIGHGVRSIEDPKLTAYLKEKNIHLEVCPTSNVKTNVVDKIEDHPADKIYRAGVSMSINTDGRTVSDVTLAEEYELLEGLFDWQKTHFFKCNLEAIEHSFASPKLKEILKNKITEAYAADD